MWRGLGLLVASVVCPVALLAQNVSARLMGSVRDASGAALPGVTVKLTNEQTGAARLATADASGQFVFGDVLPGRYTLEIQASGFKNHRQTGIEVSAGEVRSLGDIILQLGAVTETVTVEDTVAPVQLASGEKSSLITAEELENTALRGRDFLDMLRLLPGIVDEREGREVPGPDGIRGLFINGARENQKNMTVDGVTNMDTGSNNTTHTAPTVDMIREVKVLTSNYQAEFGRAVGGTIIVITKGGGKEYRGSASWFFRNEALNANDYFNNRNGLPRPPYRFNIASWSLGGPVWPRNRRHAHVFFYVTQEFTRQVVYYPARTVRVPNLLEREGDFTETYDVNNRRITVYDPLTGQPFPGNVIPKDRHHPIGRALLNMFPKPNFVDPEPSRVNQWNYISQVTGPYPRRSDMIRIDWNPASRWQTYFRYTQNADEQHPVYGVWINGSVNYDLTPLTFKQPGRGFTANVSRTIGASWMNELILGYSMNRLTSKPDRPERISRKALGLDLPQWHPELNPEGYIPNITSFGQVPNAVNPSLHNALPYRNVNHIFSIVDNVSKFHGRHYFRGGVYIERTRKDQRQGTPVRGSISFADDANNPLRTRYGFASALLGVMTSYQEATHLPYGLYRFTNLEWYIQDNWKVHRRLVLDVGMRFYRNLPQYEVRKQLAAFVADFYDPARAPVLIRNGRDENGRRVGVNPVTGQIFNPGFVGTFAPGFGDPAIGMVQGGTQGFPKSLYRGPGLVLGPRLGFAFDLTGRGHTALRGGAGVFYDRVQGNPTMNMATNPPIVFTPTVYYTTFDELLATAGSAVLAPTSVSHSLSGKGFMPTVYNYSFGIQHAVGRSFRIEIAYVGNVARHLLWRRNINPEPLGARFLNLHPENRDPVTNNVYSPNFLRPYQGYGDILQYEWGGTSNYNSLQTAALLHLKSWLQLRASYTWAKNLGTADSDTTQVSTFLKPRERNYGRLSYDRDHVLALNFTWRMPTRAFGMGPWMRSLARNWEVSGTALFSAGQPFTPGMATVDGMNFLGTGSESARPDWLGGTTFARPAPPRQPGEIEVPYFGNAGAGILRGPGINNWDFRISRRVRLLDEKRSLELRCELFNAFNHTQFSALDTTARFERDGTQINPLFLQPTAARRPRHIQLGLRLNF